MRQQRDQNTAQYTVWMPLSGVFLVLAGLSAAAALALPTPPQYPAGPLVARDLFHPEWLLAATLLAVPIYQTARRSWLAGVALAPVAALQIFYIADTAVRALHSAGLRSGAYSMWYAVAAVQMVTFLVTCAVGAVRNFSDRRWSRMMRKRFALPSHERTPLTSRG